MDNVIEILQRAGIVTTRQRVTLLDLLLRRKDHPDAESLLLDARKTMPSMSADTVYRTLSMFADAGVILRMAVPTRRARFDGSVKPHNHFLCEKCECILDLPGDEESERNIPSAAAACGEIREIQVVYIGTCQLCIRERDLEQSL